LGGHATLILSGLLPARAPDALVMLASNIWMRRTEQSALRRAQKRAVFTAWHAFTAAFGVFDAPRLRLGTDAEPLALVEQFVTFYREDHLRSRDGTLDYQAALLRARLPVLAVSSEGDRLLAHPSAVRAFVDLAPNARATHRVIRHGELAPRAASVTREPRAAASRAPGHMGLVTEARCRPLWDDIARWICATLAPGAAG
jgi:pimeloyl-ACP methyl ester carboxylesterase